MNRKLALFLLLFILCKISTAAPSNKVNPSPDLSGVRVSFVPNTGQSAARYRYLLGPQQIFAGFREDGIDLVILSPSGQRVVFPLQFGSAAALAASEPLGGRVNVLLGSDESRWRRDIPTYGRLRYSAVYPGVDLEFYGNPGELEHDFIVKPGADVSEIKIAIPTAESVHLSEDGGAVIKASGAVLKFKKPVAYQETREGRVLVEAKFRLNGHTLGFAVGNYRHGLPLVIDPAVVFSTYIADGSAPLAGVATDASGNTYVVGYTFSNNYPVAGALQPTCNNCATRADAVITKLNANGSDIIFSTYLGGSESEAPTGIGVDASGNVVVAGRTDSPDFPVKNGLPSGIPSYAQGLGFVTSLSPDGGSLNFSTLLGYSDANIMSFAMGTDGAVFVSGVTDDPNFPVTPGAIKTVSPSYLTIFLTKFQPDGSLAYSAIIGNADPQNGGGGLIGTTGIAVDGHGAAYLHGNAGQLWPTTGGAYQTSIPGTDPYAAPFITKISADGSQIVYSTFLGPAAGTAPAAIAVTAAGEAWVTGAWAGSDFPLTADAYSNQLKSGGAPYLSKLSADGSRLVYSTYVFGSISVAYPTAIKFDAAGHIWLAGYTNDHGLPLLNPIQSSFLPSGQAGYVVEFDGTGKTLLFSSYFGAQSSSQISGLAIDGASKVHLAGWSLQDLNTTPGAYRTSVSPPPQYVQYLYPFAAVIDPLGDVGSICVTTPDNGYVSFPATLVGTSVSSTVTMKNCGKANLTSLSFTLTDPQLAISSNGCTGTVTPNASCSLTIVYTPSAETTLQTTLTISEQGNVVPQELTVNGMGAVPHASYYQTALNFDPLLVGTGSPSMAIVIGNSGYVPLHIGESGISITGDFHFSTSGCAQPLTTRYACLILVDFQPTAAGDRTGTLLVPTDDSAHAVIAIALNGRGLTSYPAPVIDHLSFNTVPVGATGATIGVSGTGFFPGSKVLLNGTPQNTTYYSYTSLQFDIDPAAPANMAEVKIGVTNPAPGGGISNNLLLTTYKMVPGSYRALVYNSSTGMLYATVPTSASTDANTVLIIDPNTGQIQSRIVTGGDPNAIALSSDGQYLFVGLDGDHAVIRINCLTHEIERRFALPIDSIFGSADTVFQIAPVPGTPKAFVTSLRANRSPSTDGVALFSDTGMVNHLPYDYPTWLDVSWIAFASDPQTLYAQPFETYGASFFKTITIDSAGLHYTRPTGSYVAGGSGSTVVSDGTLLYTDAGAVWDPVTKSKVAIFSASSPATVLPDTAAQRLFLFGGFDHTPSGYSAMTLTGLDASYSKIGSLYFDQTKAGYWGRSLVRWGTNGFGVLAGTDFSSDSADQLLLLRSSLVTGQMEQVPLTIGSLFPARAMVNSGDLTIFLQGTGFQSQTTATWNGATLSSEYMNGTELKLTIPAASLTSTGTATITVSNPGGASASTTFQIVGDTQLSHSPNSLEFESVLVNASSMAKSITLSNIGSTTVNLLGMSVTGDFSLTNNCGTTIAVGTGCTVSVVFSPTAGGARTGALTVTSDAADSPRTIALSGTGTDFQLNGSGSDNSATVNAGQTASYQLSLASAGGFSGQVTLSCTGAPQYATCTVNPISTTLSANGSNNVTVSVATSQAISASVLNSPTLVLACVSFGSLLVLPLRGRKRLGSFLWVLVLIAGSIAGTAGLTSCGGGAGSIPPPNQTTHYVAPGTYTLQVKASAGPGSKTMNLTLVVR